MRFFNYGPGSAPLTPRKAAVKSVFMIFGIFIDNSRAKPMISAFALARDSSLDFEFGFGFGLPERQPLGRQIDQAARPAQYLAAALCPGTAAAAHQGLPARASRR